MIQRSSLFLLLAAGLALAPCAPADADAVVGQPAPAFKLTGLDGQPHALADYRGKVVVLEWINPNCPFSRRHAEEKTMTTTAAKHPEAVWLGINSSSSSSSEFTSAADHKTYDQKMGIGYAVLLDPDGAAGHAYGARTTPHMFVIDEGGKLLYNGAIDDDPSGRHPAAERKNYVDAALTARAAGKPVDPATTKPYGCSVKY